jgi:hypothetical protein
MLPCEYRICVATFISTYSDRAVWGVCLLNSSNAIIPTCSKNVCPQRVALPSVHKVARVSEVKYESASGPDF